MMRHLKPRAAPVFGGFGVDQPAVPRHVVDRFRDRFGLQLELAGLMTRGGMPDSERSAIS